LITVVLGLQLICVPSGLSWTTKDPHLADEYAKALGFRAKDLVGKAAPEIKPGTVITGETYRNYPGLENVLPQSLYNRFDPASYAPLAPMRIEETNQYHLGRGWLEKSLASAKTVKIGADGVTLEGYVGGYTFIRPASGAELIQWADNEYVGDTIALRPMRMRLYGRKNTPEREMRQHLNGVRFLNCTDWRPDGIQPNKEMVYGVASGTFIYPRDISGTAYVRTRFIAADRPDEFLLYVPSMRRVRRMSGSDMQDPLFGSDLIWDDYNVHAQKLSTTDFPCNYKMLPPQEMLLPTFVDYDWPYDRARSGFADYKVDEAGDQVFLHFGSWQRRWAYVCESVSKDSSYCYSKRVIVNDAETHLQLQADSYDQQGRLWRSGVRDYNLSQDGVGIMEDLGEIIDHVNQHRTILDMQGEKNPKWMGPEYGDVRFLSKKAK
jgi:hypothetical protein